MSGTPSGDFHSKLRFPPASGAIVGRRDEQQDEARIELFEAQGGIPGLLLIVADGMGGHAGGREASRIAADSFARAFHANPSAQLRPRLRQALDAANEAVGARASSRELRGMGCTIVVAVLAGNYLRWISVGDSLLLAIKNRQVVRLNADHSLAPELDRAVREGRLSREDADSDPDRHVLRSAVTGGRLNLIDEGARLVGEGALVLLATDGILTLPDDRLAQIASDGKTAERLVEELLSAIEAGMPPDQDNVTLVAARCEGTESVATRKRRARRGALGLAALLVAVLAGALSIYILIGSDWQGRDVTPPLPPTAQPRQLPLPAAPRANGEKLDDRPSRSGTAEGPAKPAPSRAASRNGPQTTPGVHPADRARAASRPRTRPSSDEAGRLPPEPKPDDIGNGV